MPKTPIDFSKTVIYKIVCNDLNIHNVYVGSTTNMVHRKSQHKSSCNNVSSKEYNQKKNKIIRLNGGWDKWSMVLIEHYPCNNKDEASSRERYWMETLNSTMNRQVPSRTKLEWQEDNTEALMEYRRKYYDSNRDKKLQYQKQYGSKNRSNKRAKQNARIICACGGCYSVSNKSQHCKSVKHQNYITSEYTYVYYWDDGTKCTEQDYYDSLI